MNEQSKGTNPVGRIHQAVTSDMASSTSESLRGRASAKAWQSATDSARYERLANTLTPEIEAAIWCLREAISLGLIDAAEFGLRPAFNGNPSATADSSYRGR